MPIDRGHDLPDSPNPLVRYPRVERVARRVDEHPPGLTPPQWLGGPDPQSFSSGRATITKVGQYLRRNGMGTTSNVLIVIVNDFPGAI